MTRPQTRSANENDAQQHDHMPAGDDARRRLLAGLPVTERHLRLNNVPTAVLEGGDGPPIILLHGPGMYAAKWFRVIPDLVETHRVIAPDLPAHGASGMFEQPPDTDGLIGWLDDLIECTCAEPPALVGQILGGAIAARFAAARGDRLQRLVLVDTLGLAPFEPAPDFAMAMTRFLSAPADDTHDRFWSVCTHDLDRLRLHLGERWSWIKAYNLDRARTPGLREALQILMERFGMTVIPDEDLARISVPTTLIWGRHDLANRLRVAEAAGSRHGWPVLVIEDAADDPVLEQPEAFLEALHTAIGDSRPATRANGGRR